MGTPMTDGEIEQSNNTQLLQLIPSHWNFPTINIHLGQTAETVKRANPQVSQSILQISTRAPLTTSCSVPALLATNADDTGKKPRRH